MLRQVALLFCILFLFTLTYQHPTSSATEEKENESGIYTTVSALEVKTEKIAEESNEDISTESPSTEETDTDTKVIEQNNSEENQKEPTKEDSAKDVSPDASKLGVAKSNINERSIILEDLNTHEKEENDSTKPKLDVINIMATKPEVLEKRSIRDFIKQEDEEDLDTAANTVFRPLFVYKQQNSDRRKFRLSPLF